MHCIAENLYFCNMITDKDAAQQYLEARKAIRDTTNPKAFLRLGMLYAKGIGTRENHVLANYFYEKALAMGSPEAEAYIDEEYASGRKSIVQKVKNTLTFTDNPTPQTVALLRKLVESERIKKNFGILSHIREHLPLLYPDYDQEKGYDDILNNRDTIDSDISYSLCTSGNRSEVNIELLDSMFQQLYAPIIQNAELYHRIIAVDNPFLLTENESVLLKCIANLKASYDSICDKYSIEKIGITHVGGQNLYPYFKVSLIPMLRKQAFRCLLSIKNICPKIDEFLNCLESDEQLLNICEEVEKQDVQLFLISFVEFNIDTDTLLIDYQNLLQSCRNHDLTSLSQLFNDFVRKITDIRMDHQLTEYTSENPPQIKIY